MKWWTGQDLNLRPPACKAGTLPTELPAHDSLAPTPNIPLAEAVCVPGHSRPTCGHEAWRSVGESNPSELARQASASAALPTDQMDQLQTPHAPNPPSVFSTARGVRVNRQSRGGLRDTVDRRALFAHIGNHGDPLCSGPVREARRRRGFVVGAAGVEPAASRSRTERATKLRHTPAGLVGDEPCWRGGVVRVVKHGRSPQGLAPCPIRVRIQRRICQQENAPDPDQVVFSLCEVSSSFRFTSDQSRSRGAGERAERW